MGNVISLILDCFFNINPKKSTKVEPKQNKKQLRENPRVIRLVADLVADYE